MKYNISESVMISKIHKAAESDAGFETLREFIFDYYYAEDDYVFEFGGAEEIFDVLSVYLESEEAYGDPLRKTRMRRLHRAIRNRHRTVEDMTAALKYDRIANLLDKFEAGVISRAVFLSQLRSLSPLTSDAEKLVGAYRLLSETEEINTSSSDTEIPIRFPREIAEKIRKLPDMDAFVSAVVREALENRSQGTHLR
ncbi:hypothetical protein [Desulfonema magnum]|uniref:Uncharacterized protein n=1 Tax=Desulfonema magnum TaxID=45655 RepID=A0A975GR60_9BACT|nr:hypothetical protein [Desulfonema magnum]QTA89698.1 Uncharacterized protein dnm_057550 [Desulfonema magnum]